MGKDQLPSSTAQCTQPIPRPWKVSSRRLAWTLLACVALLHLSSFLPFPGSSTTIDQWRYDGEHIDWRSCNEPDGHELECSEIDVPMDQFNHTRSGSKTFRIPLIRLRGKNATENLVLNPGGPGESGLDFLRRRGKEFSTIVGDGFHLLSFDPRGIDSSRPLASCYVDLDVRRQHSAVRDHRALADSPEIYAWTQTFVQACRDAMGEHGAYVNTPQTAADMNSILDAVGQDHMVYWGFSYGTILGQTYASLFPARSQRIIIDGVGNMFDWYESMLTVEALEDTETVMNGFFAECIHAGRDACRLAAHAETPIELRDRVFHLLDALDRQPLSAYVNHTLYGTLDRSDLLYRGIFTALYNPTRWDELADRLAGLLDGNATDAVLSYSNDNANAHTRAVQRRDDAAIVVLANDGRTGPTWWPQDRQNLLDLLTPLWNRSLFAPAWNRNYYQRQQWAMEHTHDFVPRRGIKTAHPLLILSNSYDPVSPLVSARSARSAFEGSQIVEVLAYGHCSTAMPSTCLAKHVRAFLYHGTVPSEHTRCPIDGEYFASSDKDGKVTALRHFEDVQDRAVHLAQLYIANDPDWPR